MWENLLLTALGGALGLLLAWLALYVGREWIFTVFDSWPNMVPEGVEVRVSGEMLFAPLVFLAALALCVVLNLLSANNHPFLRRRAQRFFHINLNIQPPVSYRFSFSEFTIGFLKEYHAGIRADNRYCFHK